MSCNRLNSGLCPAISVAISLGLNLIGNILIGLISIFGVLITGGLTETLVIVIASIFIVFNLINLIILLLLIGRQT